ncbi:uncharacterized protein si:dkeyp-121d4.3 isoform X2 [Conger conger]|uniref:uncharacterized protein si:dkeyp-121d4.3 isoform X2 n=1 Tax=Conger conger TaxID=82655 RepID=UPI002A598967|nr:uncharacterized protein si:dkeyp-121d4.3 isoform X2 [Conger conger]
MLEKQGPPLPMCPPQPPPPGWHGPSFPDGHPGYPNPDVNVMDDSMVFRPMMEPGYGPMGDPGFGPVGHDFRLHSNQFHGPRPMMELDYVPIPDMGPGPVMIRDLGPLPDRHIMPEPPEFRGFAPPFDERAVPFGPVRCPPAMGERCFGSAVRPMEGGFGTVGERELSSSSMQGPDQRAMFFDGPREFHGPPDQDMPPDHGLSARIIGLPGWVDTSMPPPGHPHDHQMTPRLPGPPVPEPPQAKLLDPPVPKKPEPQKKPKLPPKLNAKPPPGRFQGIISFVGLEYGFIERDDLKKIHFSFEAFWGDTAEMIPGVRVQFTVYKDKDTGKECATDVVVPPGGTEEVDGEILSGVVTKSPECQADAKTRKLTLPKYAGCIQATLFNGEKADLPFTTHDYMPTLLMADHVQLNLLTDLVTKERRATNIALVPNTFQYTNESRETGVVMNTKDGSGSIMSEEWSNLCFDSSENLSETELRVMDEVEFTVCPVSGKEQPKAIRVKRLPEGTVTFGKKTRARIAEAMEKNSTRFTMEKGKWKAVTAEALPQRTVVFEDVDVTQYEGTIVTTLAKASDRMQGQGDAEALPGLLVAMVAGKDCNLPFGSGDVTSEATMMPGDRVQFNICTKRSTKAERATNIELLPDRMNHSQEQREKGIVMDIRESFGFIRCSQDPQLFFHLKEVLEENKLNLMDEVEFTVTPATAGEGNQAVRVKKLLWTAFSSTPTLERLGAPSKEKKKMTIKLLRDSVNDEIKNLKVKIEAFSAESATDEDPIEPLSEPASSGKQGAGDFIPPTSKNDLQPVKMEEEGNGIEGQEKSSSGTDTPRQSKEVGEGRTRGDTADRGRVTRAGKYGSPHREHGRRRSRSRSSERGYRHERRYRRSRSRSRERSGRGGRRRSRSREREDSYSRRRGSGGGGRESAKTGSRDGSGRKSDDKNGPLVPDRGGEPVPRLYPKPVAQELPRSENILDEELSRKKRELEELEEHIARKRAIMAMAQKGLALKGQAKKEDSESGYFPPPQEPTSADKPAAKPMKSILKKRTEPFVDFCDQSEIPKNLPLKSNFESQSGFGSPPVDHPPFLDTSESSFNSPPDRPPLSQSIPQREPVCHPPRSQSAAHKLPFHQLPVCYSPPNQEAPAKSTASTQFEGFLRTKSVSQSEPVHQPPRSQSAAHKLPSHHPPVCYSPPNQQAPAKSAASTQFEGFLRTKSVPQPDSVRYSPHSQSAAHQSAYEGPPAGRSPPRQQASTTSAASTQFERFLRTLNKGVDASLLTSLVKEAKEEALTLEAVKSHMPPRGEVLYKDEDSHEDSHRTTTEEPDDFLLPHERAFLDGGGFSRIVGMKHGPEAKEDSWREGDVEDEERFLYGEGTVEGEHGSAKVEAKEEVDKRLREPSQTEEEPKPREDKMSHYDNIQSLLQTIGLDLDISEVSKLTDRTQERLYGKKQKARPPGQAGGESGRAASRSGRHRSQTDSPASDRTRSISPAQTSHREVYMSHHGALEHSSVHDKEKISAIVKMVRSMQRSHSPSRSTPSSTSTSSSSKYSHAPSEPYSQYQNAPEHEHTYSQHNATLTAWNNVPLQPEVQSSSAYSQHPGSYIDSQHSGSYATLQHSGSYVNPPQSGSYVNPQHPGSYVGPPSTFVNVPVSPHAMATFLPTHSLPNVPLASPVGLPSLPPSTFVSTSVQLPPFVGQPPPTFTGATSYYPLHPLPGVPVMPMGAPTFPDPEPVAMEWENDYEELVTTRSRCLRVIQKVHLPGQKVKTVSNLKEVTMTCKQSSVSTLPPCSAPSESTEKKQLMTISEDDIKAKQKKRLEQFNERMRRKKEQQKEAMKSRVESQKIPPGKTCTEVKNVWVCGHSLVFWAEKRAKSPEYGMQLGMDPSRVRVWWKGMQGMTWDQLLPQLLKLKGTWPNPDVIILHLGGNDLGKSDLGVLLEAVRKDMASLRGIFPDCLLVWSDILPRRSWRTAEDADAMESNRALVNKRVGADVIELGGAVVSHRNIRPGSDAGLYRPDGVHLSGKGIDMFNIDLQDFLEKWEEK